ncbi:hypothetical protein G7Y89_g2081 [Cudoniella acicularis]|uniref:BTB domain-containing protein n=1 Tax=Cudoniella acicularis TaxID=354080 RepID=A0A8H4RVR1_9HELO|nr:hypothetical protein G7Y89_g2081 [Cudoniella acicularis]
MPPSATTQKLPRKRHMATDIVLLAESLPISQVISLLNRELVYRKRKTTGGFSKAIHITNADVARARENFKDNIEQRVKPPTLQELIEWSLKYGDSGLLVGGTAETSTPPNFTDGAILFNWDWDWELDSDSESEEEEDMGQKNKKREEVRQVEEKQEAGGKEEIFIEELLSKDDHDDNHTKHENVRRPETHSDEVCKVLGACPHVLQIVVQNAQMTCHSGLLSLYSEFFDKECNTTEEIRNRKEIDLTEDFSPKEMSAFISWAYSSKVESTLALEKLWGLGWRLESPRFMNAVMQLFFDNYAYGKGKWLSASTVEFVYTNMRRKSPLRQFVKHHIIANGPLSARSLTGRQYGFEAEWKALIRKGGDLASDIAVESSFSNDDPSQSPCRPERWAKYLLPITTRPTEEIVNGTLRLKIEDPDVSEWH